VTAVNYRMLFNTTSVSGRLLKFENSLKKLVSRSHTSTGKKKTKTAKKLVNGLKPNRLKAIRVGYVTSLL